MWQGSLQEAGSGHEAGKPRSEALYGPGVRNIIIDRCRRFVFSNFVIFILSNIIIYIYICI